jgi:cobaltochelatase CobS
METPLTPTATTSSFLARENAICIHCGNVIKAGTPITWNRKKAGAKYHPDCLVAEVEAEKKQAPAPVEVPAAPTVAPSDKMAWLVSQMREVVREELGAMFPAPVESSSNMTCEGPQHFRFGFLMKQCTAKTKDGNRLNVWVAGPAGTGKTTAAMRVAGALGLQFRSMGTLSDPTQLVGYLSPVTGQYVSTPFREVFENGGIILLDEIDGSDPNALLVANQALANSWYNFPDKLVKRHKDCVVVAAANTWGLGATNDYVGRLKMDAAFLNRFVSCNWPIDEKLEMDTCENKEWVKRVQKYRATVKRLGIKVLVTPRASYYGEALLNAGMTIEEAEESAIKGGMTDEQWELVKRG